MQKYTDLVLGQNGQTLLPVSGASVLVLAYPSGSPAQIYSDNGVTITPNPLTTDLNGRYSFYAANGRYSIQVTYGSLNYTIQDFPLEDDPANGNTTVITGGSIDNTPIGATTPSTGSFTTLNSTGGALNGTIGATTPAAGTFTSLTAASLTLASINNTPIGNTTPSTGAFTTLSATGSITPSQTAGIVGTTTNNSVTTGSVGEFVTATTGSSVPLTTTIAANVISISLTAGDWDIGGGIAIIGSTANMTDSTGGASVTSATFGGFGTFFELVATAYTNNTQTIPRIRVSIATTTTVFLVARATFAAGTVSANGTINARRVR